MARILAGDLQARRDKYRRRQLLRGLPISNTITMLDRGLLGYIVAQLLGVVTAYPKSLSNVLICPPEESRARSSLSTWPGKVHSRKW